MVFYHYKTDLFQLKIIGTPAYYNTVRLRGYSLRVSNNTTVPSLESSCYTDPGKNTLPTIIEEDCEKTSRYLWIYQSKKPFNLDICPILEICEVQVFGKLNLNSLRGCFGNY